MRGFLKKVMSWNPSGQATMKRFQFVCSIQGQRQSIGLVAVHVVVALQLLSATYDLLVSSLGEGVTDWYQLLVSTRARVHFNQNPLS